MSARKTTRDRAEQMKQFFYENPEKRFTWPELLAKWDMQDSAGTRRAFKLCRELAWRDGWLIPKAVGARGNTYILTKKSPEIIDSELAVARQETGTTKLRRQHDTAMRRDTAGLAKVEVAWMESREKMDALVAEMHSTLDNMAAAMIADRRTARKNAEAKQATV